MMFAKPYSESCDANKHPILQVIQPLLANANHVLEIGSGTGQHAVFFAHQMPHLVWQTSDQAQYHHGINQWLGDTKLDNTPPPLTLDVSQPEWPTIDADAIFTANSLHIMSWKNVQDCFAGVGQRLSENALFIIYGPFNYSGQYTSESNQRFDNWLKQRDPKSGIRDIDDLQALGQAAQLTLIDDIEMPVNNRILVWQKH